MPKTSNSTLYVVDGSFDFSGGVDSSKVTTLQSDLNENGLKRSQVAWLNNASVRTCGINQRTGWQPLIKMLGPGYYWQGGFMYQPDGANPYLVCQVSGVIYRVLLEPPYTVTDLTGGDPALLNPADPAVAEMAWFCQAENYLVIQAGDYYTTVTPTLPLFWDGTILRRSIGITNPAPAIAPNQNEIPAATCMDYYGGRIWYARSRFIGAGDTVGGGSGTAGNRFRDAVLSVTENPLCYGGDGFSIPTDAGNIRAIKHSAQLNASLGQGQLYIFTRKTVFELTVPADRGDWIATDINSMPKLTVVQLVNGAVGDRSVLPINGDLYYQSFDPAVRSLKRAQNYFDTPGNTTISQNEERVLQLNDRSLMRFSSGISFDQRILNLVLPQMAPDGLNVIHTAVLPLNFDVVTNFQDRKDPVWEGVYDGQQFLQLFEGDFGGLPRAFGAIISELDESIGIWELTTSSRTENGDNRVLWGAEFPAYTWAQAGYEFQLKQLNGGELWIDKVSGTVDVNVYYRVDADPCWRAWTRCSICAKRCEDEDAWGSAYPCEPYREGYRYPLTFPEPPVACDSMNVRPTTIGYQFQVKVLIKGWCRIRGILLHALPKEKPQFQGICCLPSTKVGMASLPDPFAAQDIPPFTPPAPTSCLITTDTVLSPATVFVYYQVSIDTSGGSGLITLSISSGTLPDGLSFSTSGVISGTPTTAGTSVFTVSGLDKGGRSCSKEFSMTVYTAVCLITSDSPLPNGTDGSAYSQQIASSGGEGALSFSVTAGSLPSGLSMDASGLITGTPDTVETQTFTVTATDTVGRSCSKEFSITIDAAASEWMICGWNAIAPLMSFVPHVASAHAIAWDGVFTNSGVDSFGNTKWYFLNQAVNGADGLEATSFDEAHPPPSLDTWEFTQLGFFVGVNFWGIIIANSDGTEAWRGHNAALTDPSDPSGVYFRDSGAAVAEITVVSAAHPELCP